MIRSRYPGPYSHTNPLHRVHRLFRFQTIAGISTDDPFTLTPIKHWSVFLSKNQFRKIFSYVPSQRLLESDTFPVDVSYKGDYKR